MARGRSTKNIGGSGPVGCQQRTLYLPHREACAGWRRLIAPLHQLSKHDFPSLPFNTRTRGDALASCRSGQGGRGGDARHDISKGGRSRDAGAVEHSLYCEPLRCDPPQPRIYCTGVVLQRLPSSLHGNPALQSRSVPRLLDSPAPAPATAPSRRRWPSTSCGTPCGR